MSAKEVVDEVSADLVFYQNSGGGVTLSGGEVLLQARFALEVLKLLKRNGIHTIVETAGYGEPKELLVLAPYADLFYYDLKLMDAEMFLRYVNGDVRVVLENLRLLREKTERIVIRVPLIPSITDTRENLNAIYAFALELDISQVHLLPYNPSAGAKYEWCSRTYHLEATDAEGLAPEELAEMAPSTLRVSVVR